MSTRLSPASVQLSRARTAGTSPVQGTRKEEGVSSGLNYLATTSCSRGTSAGRGAQ